MLTIVSIVILIFSVIVHEVAHGYTAERLGDPTARLAGRLTLNPLKHIDPIGSILVPIITSLGGFTFGWAKPVPYNPYNIRNRRVGELLVALAGPASNILLAGVFGTIIRFLLDQPATVSTSAFITVCSYIVLINIVLALFNLIPLPPLDGSKILYFFLPNQFGRARFILEQYSFVWVLLVVFFLWRFIGNVLIPPLFTLFTGAHL